jgi:FkbM family methyltransferase
MPTAPVVKRRSALARHRRMSITRAVRDPRARRYALHHLFQDHLAAGILCLVRFDDYELFVDPRDDKIAFTLLSGRQWQRRQFDNALAVLDLIGRPPRGRVFLDVGANIGTITIYALQSGRFDHVIAIEPDDANRAILERNLAHNGLAERVTVVAAAASRAAGTMTLHRDAKNLGAHSLEASFARTPAPGQPVRVDTLDNIITEAGVCLGDVDFAKIDVEGHEVAVLDGMPTLLSNTPPSCSKSPLPCHRHSRPDRNPWHPE